MTFISLLCPCGCKVLMLWPGAGGAGPPFVGFCPMEASCLQHASMLLHESTSCSWHGSTWGLHPVPVDCGRFSLWCQCWGTPWVPAALCCLQSW